MVLRYGYTTGSCAAAATKACCYMLKFGKKINLVEIKLPIGKKAAFEIHDVYLDKRKAVCFVVKDAGDEPDVTNGLKIYSEVQLIDKNVVEITGGKGIGIVTKPGLEVPVGDYAINPIPRIMIYKAVKEFFEDGIKVIISAPDGETVAKKTFNEKLGIMGGISILGTTGIVKPFSLSSLKCSIITELKVARALGYKTIVIVPGNIGKSAVKKFYNVPDDKIVMVSNFIGEMLIEAAKLFKNIILIGHPGKLIKLLNGDFNTHSRFSKPAIYKVKSDIQNFNLNGKLGKRIADSSTVEGIIKILPKNIKSVFFRHYAIEIEKVIKNYIKYNLAYNMKKTFNNVGVALIDMKGNFVAKGEFFLSMESEIE